MPSLARQNALVLLEMAYEAWRRDIRQALPRKGQAWLAERDWYIANEAALPSRQALRPVALPVAAKDVLLRFIRLPLASKPQLVKLMQFEALQQVPLPLGQVRIDYRIIQRDLASSRMQVEMAIIRSETIASMLADAKIQGCQVDAIAIASEHGAWMSRPLAGKSWKDALFNRRVLKLAGKIAVPVFLALLCILAAQNWTSRLAANRQADIVAAENDAASIAPMRQQLSALNAQLSYFAQQRSQPTAAAITEEAARLLPDDAWLQELDIEQGTVTIRGTAAHATDLLKIFAASPLFSNVAFAAPLTQAFNGTGQQFAITMTRN
jgi:general secretion pathway protein L